MKTEDSIPSPCAGIFLSVVGQEPDAAVGAEATFGAAGKGLFEGRAGPERAFCI